MTDTSAARSGYLVRGDDKFAVTVREASRYSLFVVSDAERALPNGATFERLVLEGKNESVELGSCLFLRDDAANKEVGGRLVFLNELYDFDKLLGRDELHTLGTYFQSLPLVLEQKKRIRDDFKEYTSSLTFDINVYKSYFDSLDAIFRDEPEPVKSAAIKAVLESKGREFLSFFDDGLRVLEEKIAGFTRDEHQMHAYYFRKQIWGLAEPSQFLWRTNVKPRGYAGDSDMMQMIYENDYRGDSIFARLMHKHPIETAAAQAVRNRRIMVPNILRETRGDLGMKKGDPFHIMSVACGPAWEMQDLFAEDEDFQDFHVTLLDQDTEALEEARAAIREIEGLRETNVNVRFLEESVRTMLRIKNISEEWGKYHFIYSMGLFDYLAAPVARAVLKKLYDMLLPGGHLLIGNYHVDNPTRWYMEYWMDWVLLYRSEDEFTALLRDIKDAKHHITFEDTRAQMFLHVTKPG